MTKISDIIRIDDAARAKRLQEQSEVDNPTSLLPEIYVLRLLEEEMLNAGNTRAVVEIAAIIGKLSQSTEATKLRRGELLTKSVVLTLASRIAQLLANKVAGRFEGWEDLLDEVRQESQALIIDARNVPDNP